MRGFLILVTFLIVNLFTSNLLFAQQKDSTMLSEMDSLRNVLTPQDSSAFDIKKEEKQTPLDSVKIKSSDKSVIVGFPEIKKDSTIRTSIDKKSKKWSRPKKTMVLAMLLPGAGQIYNHKYWKLPILYVGAGALAYFWVTNQRFYSEFKNQYKTENNNLTADPNYTFVYYSNNTKSYYTSVSQLASDRDTYRRYRDLSIAGSVALYAISILDAYVDAHLRTFDLSPDLSVTAKPLFYKNNATFVTGVSLNFNFKNNRSQYNQLLKKDF